MARSQTKKSKKVQEEEDDASDIDYEVNKILKHKRVSGALTYYVSWVGYDNAEDNTWIDEESAAGASELVNLYWKSLPASKQHEREAKPVSKKSGASTNKSPAKASSASKKRPVKAIETDEEDQLALDDEEEEEVEEAPKARRKSGAKVNGTSGGGRKSITKDESPEIKEDTKASKKSAKAPAAKKSKKEPVPPTPEPEEDEVDPQEGYSGERKESDLHIKYADRKSWETLVSAIDTVERKENDEIKLWVIWAEDESASWVDSSIARQKCPQKIIEFYESHLKFTPSKDIDEDEIEIDEQ